METEANTNGSSSEAEEEAFLRESEGSVNLRAETLGPHYDESQSPIQGEHTKV